MTAAPAGPESVPGAVATGVSPRRPRRRGRREGRLRPLVASRSPDPIRSRVAPTGPHRAGSDTAAAHGPDDGTHCPVCSRRGGAGPAIPRPVPYRSIFVRANPTSAGRCSKRAKKSDRLFRKA
jgi:hypothetical protein